MAVGSSPTRGANSFNHFRRHASLSTRVGANFGANFFPFRVEKVGERHPLGRYVVGVVGECGRGLGMSELRGHIRNGSAPGQQQRSGGVP